MAKVLLVVPPLTGHINPLLSVAEELKQRQHVVAWAGHSEALRHHVDESDVHFPLPETESTFVDESWHKVRGLESVKFFYEEYCFPMAEVCFQPLEMVVRTFQPVLMIVDHQMLAGAFVARKLGVPWISSISTSASVLKLWEVLDQWLEAHLKKLQHKYGLEKNTDKVERPDFSDEACVIYSSKELVGLEQKYVDAPYFFVGPLINHKRKPIDFPWDQLISEQKKVLVSLGTVSRDRSRRFYNVIAQALRDTKIQVILGAPDGYVDDVPDNFVVMSRVPQLALLPHMDLVVSHAGHNTVCETLAQGIPMVVSPIRDDQSVIARQVINAGAGLGIRFGKVSVNSARETILNVLDESSFKEAAEKIQASFNNLGGSLEVVNVVENILANHHEVSYASA